MLHHQQTLRFIQDHEKCADMPCNILYKSQDGIYLAANERTANIAGVSHLAIRGKRDAELSWHAFHDDYLRSDASVANSKKSILTSETCLDMNKQEAQILTAKYPVYSTENHQITGILGFIIYIEELAAEDLPDLLLYFKRCLPISMTSDKFTWSRQSKNSPELTQREKQCAKLIAEGFTAKEIGNALCLSRRTVEYYIANLKDKLNVNRKSALIQRIKKSGLA